MIENEIWKSIPDYDGLYEVSNLGRVRSIDRIVNGRNFNGVMLSLQTDKDGYKRATILKDGKAHNVGVHRLVASAFIPNPDNLPSINHKNEIKDDNRPENLEWCTVAYNNSYNNRNDRIGLQKRISIDKLDLDGNYVETYDSARTASKIYGGDGATITACCRGEQYSAYGFLWRYTDESLRFKQREKHIKTRAVLAYTRSGEFVKRFESIKDAANAIGVFAQSIGACCSGRIAYTGGYVFKYENNDNSTALKKVVGKKYKRSVDQLTINGDYIATYESAREAGRVTGAISDKITACCLGKRNSTCGYTWRYTPETK